MCSSAAVATRREKTRTEEKKLGRKPHDTYRQAYARINPVLLVMLGRTDWQCVMALSWAL